MKQNDARGTLVGGFIVIEGDEVLAVKQSGQVTRSAIDHHLRSTSRDTKGVKFVGVRGDDAVVQVARSVESALDNDGDIEATSPVADAPVEPALETDGSGAGDTIDDGASVEEGDAPDDSADEGADQGAAPGAAGDGPEETRES